MNSMAGCEIMVAMITIFVGMATAMPLVSRPSFGTIFAHTTEIKNYGAQWFVHLHVELDESTARQQLKSPRSLSVRSLHLTLVIKWSRSHITLKIQISRSWPRSNPLSNLRPRVQIDMFPFRLVAIGPLLVEI